MNYNKKRLQELAGIDIHEGKQVGTLYHFTNFEGLNGILSSNLLKVGDDANFETGGNIGNVSLTRDKNLWYFSFRLELDGDKMSDKYKITPYQWNGGDQEAEEYIERDISDISSYLLSITVWVNNPDDTISKSIINRIIKMYPNLEFVYQDFRGKDFIEFPNPQPTKYNIK